MNSDIQDTVRKLERRYKDMPDEYILQEVRMGHHAGEALFYLLFGRYAGMLEIIYSQQSLTLMDFDDFMLELDIRLFKDECQAVLRFQPEKASFKTYLSRIARNLLYDLREKELPTLDIYALWETLYDNSEGKEVIWLVEAINSYPNKDSRFVLLKTIEGYKSKEIATMLTSRRHEEGTLDQDEELKPSYIDTLRSRALKAIRNSIFGKDKLRSVDVEELKPFYIDTLHSLKVTHNSIFDEDELYDIDVCKSCVSAGRVPRMDYGTMADMPTSKPQVEMLLFKAGLFINNIKNLYNQMMKDYIWNLSGGGRRKLRNMGINRQRKK